MPTQNPGRLDPMACLVASAPLPYCVQAMLVERYGPVAGYLARNPFIAPDMVVPVFKVVARYDSHITELAQYPLTPRQLDMIASLPSLDAPSATLLLVSQRLSPLQATAISRAPIVEAIADKAMYTSWLPSSAKAELAHSACPRARAEWLAFDTSLSDDAVWEKLFRPGRWSVELAKYPVMSLAIVLASRPGLRARFVADGSPSAWCALLANGTTTAEQTMLAESLHRFSDTTLRMMVADELGDDPSTAPEVIAYLDDTHLKHRSRGWASDDVRGLGVGLESITSNCDLTQILSRASASPNSNGIRPFQWVRLARNPHLTPDQRLQLSSHLKSVAPYLSHLAAMTATAAGMSPNMGAPSVLREPLEYRKPRKQRVAQASLGADVRFDDSLHPGEHAAHAGAYLETEFGDCLASWQTAFSLMSNLEITAHELVSVVRAARATHGE